MTVFAWTKDLSTTGITVYFDNATPYEVEILIDSQVVGALSGLSYARLVVSQRMHVLSVRDRDGASLDSSKEVFLAASTPSPDAGEVEFYIFNVNAKNDYRFLRASYGPD